MDRCTQLGLLELTSVLVCLLFLGLLVVRTGLLYTIRLARADLCSCLLVVSRVDGCEDWAIIL